MIGDTPLFIGLAGTLSAGKDSLAEALARDHGFLHMSTSDMLREIKRRTFGADSPKALLVRNDPFVTKLRDNKGPGFLIAEIYKTWQEQSVKYPSGFIASGMRAVGEAELVQQLSGVNIFVDADPHVRYMRSLKRSRDSVDEGKTFDEFMAIERSEMDVDPTDKSVTNLVAMREMADIIIDNNYESVAEFEQAAIAQLQAYIGRRDES